MRITSVLSFLVLTLCAHAEDVYHTHRLSEPQLLNTYTSLMRDACHHADQFWHEWPVDARAGFWGSGRSDQMNEGVRAISGMVLTCGALLKYSDVLTDAERREYLRKSVAAIRYAVATHVSGTEKCPDGKPWGNSWQSAMWTADLAFGASLIWQNLDVGLRKDLERVVAFEADRFLNQKPPAGTFNDTKAEENGWNLTCLDVAATLLPDHPHAAAWNQKAIEYMMNTLSAPQDQEDPRVVDGRAVRDWFAGANVHPDFTLENHGFFHPGYVGCSSYFMTQTALYYTAAHRPVPQAASHHLLDTWRMFQGILLPNGESACPQGMDWELHGLPYVNLFASLAGWKHDAPAARLENRYLQYMRSWQEMLRGDLATPGSKLGFTRHAICAQQAAYGFLAHKIFGPPAKELSEAEARSLVEGVRMHDWIALITHRTGSKFVSFSWTNRVMGMLIPLGSGHEGNPDFTVPVVTGFVGGFDLIPRGDAKTTSIEHIWKKTENGFETTGTLLVDGGRLKQILRVTSLGDKTVLYQDRVIAVSAVQVAHERGFPLGIENDEVTGGSRSLSFETNRMIFDFKKPQHPLPMTGTWANVDGRLGLVMIAGRGIVYNQATGYQPGISVCSDILYGSFSDQPKHFKAGEEVAHRVALCFAEVTPKETAALARSFKIEKTGNGQTLRFKMPDGKEAIVPLL